MAQPIPFTTDHESKLVLIGSVLDDHSIRFDKVELRLDKVEARLDKVEARLDKVEARLDKIEARLDKIEARLDNLEIRVDRLEQKVDLLSEECRRTRILVEDFSAKLDTVLEVVVHMSQRFNKIDPMDAKLEEHENRISTIEQFLKKDA